MSLESGRPFTWRQGRDAGVPQRALGSPRFPRVVSGVYVPRDVTVDAVTEGRAALLVAGRHAFLSHQTAARVWGGVTPHTPQLHAAVPPGSSRSTHRDVTVHVSRRSPQVFRGLPLSSATDTFLDLATHLSLVDLVVLGDSLVRRGRFTPAQLVDAMQSARGRGIRPARRAAALVRRGVDSPMETRSRLLRVLSGLPELETDIRFLGPHGELVRRLDAGDRKTRTGVEYDGRQHIEREQQWEQDIGRREEFENGEWRLVTLVSRDIYVTPDRTVSRLARIFTARGMRVGPVSDEWRRHFPVRHQQSACVLTDRERTGSCEGSMHVHGS